MPDTRFDTVVENTQGLLSCLEFDGLGDVETLMMCLYSRPVNVREEWDDDGMTASLEITLHGDDTTLESSFEYPLRIDEVVRSCAADAERLGPYELAEPAPRLLAVSDDELTQVFQEALGQVRLFNLLDKGGDA